ncbi:hypothetical protein RchiOBHm_Chr5g0007001 [Rosa chinensis]|uniref:Uncharacterized protein n=1 Tax=Rosa chinensis TaxID=74649 RepID=A0A2P6Q3Q6_ROSCH|nr:hypothetical protein RchiOBHm_Chr5g0007001 [Rosa chinensis]
MEISICLPKIFGVLISTYESFLQILAAASHSCCRWILASAWWSWTGLGFRPMCWASICNTTFPSFMVIFVTPSGACPLWTLYHLWAVAF